MRIVSGKFRGMEIIPPSKELNLRPTTDRVREAIFDVIRFKVEDSIFLDLFAGTGAVGIEAISEGAKYSVFVEKHPSAIRKIRANIKRFKIEDETFAIKQDVLKFLETPEEFVKIKFDIVFLDPPYISKLATRTLLALSDFKLLNNEALIIAEHLKEEHLKEEYIGYNKLTKFKEKSYGKVAISYYILEK